MRKKEHKKSNVRYKLASKSDRFKAWVVDSFMIMTPIVYAVIYLYAGGREGFAHQRATGWLLVVLISSLAYALFWSKSAQTPGQRAYDLKVVQMQSGAEPTFFISLFRALLMWLGAALFVGVLLFLFRRDGQSLQDILSATVVVQK